MPEQLSMTIERFKRWSRSLIKKDRKASAEKSVSAEESLNPRMFQLYFKSGRVADMRDLKFNIWISGNKKDVRNHLILCIASENCCRLGPVINMTINELRKGLMYIRNGHHVVRVLNHKMAKHGPAELVLTRDLYSMVKQYISEIRPVSPSAEVFLTLNGNLMDSSTVINAMSIELRQASVSTHVTCTKLRHLAMSVIYVALPGSSSLKRRGCPWQTTWLIAHKWPLSATVTILIQFKCSGQTYSVN